MTYRSAIRATLAAAACVVSAIGAQSVAVAAPAQARIVGAASINDPGLLAREGWILRAQPAPHLLTDALLRAVPDYGALLPDPRGGVVLLGRYGWVFEGRDVAHLRTLGWGGFSPLSRNAGTPYLLSDGGWVIAAIPGVTSGNILGLAPDLSVRWSLSQTPTAAAPPVALASEGTLYAVGGTPSVLDARTGRVLAALQDPAPFFSAPVAAPDGTLRVVGTPPPSVLADPGTLSLYAYERDGRQRWRVPVSESPLNQLTTTPLSIGPDGTTYIASPQSTPAGRLDWVLTAIGSDGAVRWRIDVGRGATQPAIDSRGYVWTTTRNGTAIAIDPTGQIAFRRRVLPAGSGYTVGTIMALGQGVIAQAGNYEVRLEARSSAAPPKRVRLTATPVARVRVRPLICVAPPAGRPRTCVFPVNPGAQVEISTPVDQTIRLSVRRAGQAKLLYRQGPYRILAGVDRIRLDLAGGAACNAFFPCSVPPGRYVVSARVRTGPGRSRVVSAPVRVLAGAGPGGG